MEEKIIQAYTKLRREQKPSGLGYITIQELCKKIKPPTIAKFKEIMQSFIKKHTPSEEWTFYWGSYNRPEVKRYSVCIEGHKCYYYMRRNYGR